MDPITGGLLSGGIGAIASLFNTSQNNANAQEMQQQAEQFNQQQTMQQEAFQTSMSNTAYQRSSADMTKAGLNPMMMFGGGSAASTPSGGASTIQPAQKTSAAGGVGSALQSIVPTAVSLKTADATINNLVQQNANLKTDQINKAVDTGLKTEQAGQAVAGARKTEAETANIRASAPIVENAAQTAKNQLDIDSSARSVADKTKFYGQSAAPAIGSISNLVSSARGIKGIMPQRSTTETTKDDGSSSFSERFNY